MEQEDKRMKGENVASKRDVRSGEKQMDEEKREKEMAKKTREMKARRGEKKEEKT